MNLHVPVRDRSPQAQALTEEAAFRERLLAALPAIWAGEVDEKSLREKIDAAITRGADALWKLQAEDGGWHSVTWVVDRPPAEAAVLLIGLGACVYAAMIAYTALPAAWTAWSDRPDNRPNITTSAAASWPPRGSWPPPPTSSRRP